MRRRVGRATWLSALLGLAFIFVAVPSTESFACHKYVSKKTGAKGCSAWRADKRKNKSNSKTSKNSKSKSTSKSPASGSTTAASSSPPPSGGGGSGRLQWNGEWIGGSPSAATQLFPVPVGLTHNRKSGKAAVALRVKIRETGTLVGVSVLVRMNRPWTSDSKRKYGGYSIGDGGRAIIEIRKVKYADSPDPRNWIPDMSKSGLLGETEINGHKSIKSPRDKYLQPYIMYGKKRTIPMWEWKLKNPLKVREGEYIFIVIRHVSDRTDARFSINANGVYGEAPWKSKPFGRSGPVYGDFETMLYTSDGMRWRVRDLRDGWHPVYALIYSDGTVRGWPFAVGNSSCRDRIGGKKWARMKMTIPNRYPKLIVNGVSVTAFRSRKSASDLIIELRDARMRLLNMVSIPSSSFTLGVPQMGDRSRPGGDWTFVSFPATEIGPGTYYIVLRSTTTNTYWLQGFSDNTPYIVQNMLSKSRPRFVDALDVDRRTYQIEKSNNAGRSWSRWKGYCEVFPVLFRTR